MPPGEIAQRETNCISCAPDPLGLTASSQRVSGAGDPLVFWGNSEFAVKSLWSPEFTHGFLPHLFVCVQHMRSLLFLCETRPTQRPNVQQALP